MGGGGVYAVMVRVAFAAAARKGRRERRVVGKCVVVVDGILGSELVCSGEM